MLNHVRPAAVALHSPDSSASRCGMSLLQDDVAVVFCSSIDKASSGVVSHPACIFAFSVAGVQHHKNQREAAAFTTLNDKTGLRRATLLYIIIFSLAV